MSGYASTIALSPDGGLLAAGLSDGTVVVWDAMEAPNPERFLQTEMEQTPAGENSGGCLRLEREDRSARRQRWCASSVSPAFGQPTETKKALTVVAI